MEPKHFESLYPDSVYETELTQLVAYLKEGNAAQIIGIPGVGRSVLLGILTYNRAVREKHLGNLGERAHFVLCDFDEIKNQKLLEAVKFMFSTLVQSLSQRNMQEEFEYSKQMLKESISYNDELMLFQGLKTTVEYLALQKKLAVCFLFEQFERYVPMLTPQFFTQLRSLRSAAKYRFNAVFAVNRPLEELMESEMLVDFYEYVAGNTIYLPLSNPVALDFRMHYLQKVVDKELDKNVYKKVLAETGSHGKLTKLGVELLLVEQQADDISTLFLANKPICSALFDIWYSLNPSEQKHLLYLANGNHPEPIDPYDYLENVHLIANTVIQIPLLITFLQEKFPKNEMTQTHIRYDEKTRMIIEGNKYISDRLTASEYRLLKYLLERPDIIISRDEIINAVWQITASTAGVSEQALDQLIFRLRKKIEEEIANPTHLQTIKGRGFKFTP